MERTKKPIINIQKESIFSKANLLLQYKKEKGCYPSDIYVTIDTIAIYAIISNIDLLLFEIKTKPGGVKESIIIDIKDNIKELNNLIEDICDNVNIDLNESEYITWLEEELIKLKNK